jgi:ribosomal-protein-alanine N-acetyltransferase
MINNIDIKDEDRFISLGLLINHNFSKLYDLNTLIDDINNEIYGYYDNNNLVGFIHIIKAVDSIDVINIVVYEKYRRRGIASKLIDNILKKYDNDYTYFLEVRESNKAAIDLYNNNGFKIINIRKKYYDDEDAIIMKRGD